MKPTGMVASCWVALFVGTVAHAQKPELVAQSRLFGNRSASAFSPDGRVMLTADNYGDLSLWHAATGKPFRRLGSHSDALTATNELSAVFAGAFSADGLRVLSGSRDKTARLPCAQRRSHLMDGS